jgi:phosphate-selective porin OprO/OprP
MADSLFSCTSGRFAAFGVIVAVALTGCTSLPVGPGQADRQTTEPTQLVPPAAPSSGAQEAPVAQGRGAAPTVADLPSTPVVVAPAPPMAEEPKPTKPIFVLRGRIQAEAALVSQSSRDQAILGTIDDGVGFRRARLGAEGTVGEQVRWVAEFDFAGGNVAFKDVYVAATNLPVVRELRVGNFLEPFSLEGATSSNYMPFVERSPAIVFDPARHWGVGLFSYTDEERMTFQAGVFRSGSNNTGNDISNSNDLQYTARITALPWYDGNSDGSRLLHVGAAFSQQYAKNNTITYSQGPQSNLLSVSDNPGSPFEPTVTITATGQQLYNVQSALVLGPLSFQAEYSAADVEQVKGGPVFFHGGYVSASYFLTGEHRDYLPKEGAFGSTQVRSPFWCLTGNHGLAGGPGAWELTARFSYVNLSSANLPLAANGLQMGSRDTEFTLGINWYLNDNTRLMFNWVHAVPVVPSLGPSFGDAFFISSQIYW